MNALKGLIVATALCAGATIAYAQTPNTAAPPRPQTSQELLAALQQTFNMSHASAENQAMTGADALKINNQIMQQSQAWFQSVQKELTDEKAKVAAKDKEIALLRVAHSQMPLHESNPVAKPAVPVPHNMPNLPQSHMPPSKDVK